MRKQFILLIMLSLFFACLGFGDIVHLKSGKDIEGEVISSGTDKVTLRLPMGKQGDIVYTLEKSKIDSIEEAPVSYDFFEEDVDEKGETVNGNKFSVENILNKVLDILRKNKGSTKEKDIKLTESGERIKAYIYSSGLVGFISNFILMFLAISIFNVFRKESSVIAAGIDKKTGVGLLLRWLFFTGGLILVQFQRFGSFDFVRSGIISICLLITICYETLGFVIMMLFKKQYKAFLSGGKTFSVIVFKVPIAFEFTLFIYLLLMSLFVMLI